jgi:hypothetical protein
LKSDPNTSSLLARSAQPAWPSLPARPPCAPLSPPHPAQPLSGLGLPASPHRHHPGPPGFAARSAQAAHDLVSHLRPCRHRWLPATHRLSTSFTRDPTTDSSPFNSLPKLSFPFNPLMKLTALKDIHHRWPLPPLPPPKPLSQPL